MEGGGQRTSHQYALGAGWRDVSLGDSTWVHIADSLEQVSVGVLPTGHASSMYALEHPQGFERTTRHPLRHI
jgi:hypothetical protein